MTAAAPLQSLLTNFRKMTNGDESGTVKGNSRKGCASPCVHAPVVSRLGKANDAVVLVKSPENTPSEAARDVLRKDRNRMENTSLAIGSVDYHGRNESEMTRLTSADAPPRAPFYCRALSPLTAICPLQWFTRDYS